MPAQGRKVVSLVGAGRSGSTLLSGILGEVPGVVDAGELRWLWARDLPGQRICGCGAAPADCPVWSQVTQKTTGLAGRGQSGDVLASEVAEVVAAQREVGRLRSRGWLLRGADPRPGTGADAALRELREATLATIEALFSTTGASVVVDASKRPQEAAVLARGGLDHYVVHMVRDPRAVVHSWRRSKPLPAAAGKAAMGTRSMRRTLWRWVENAAGAELLRRHVPEDRWFFLRYEDLAERPYEVVGQILRFVGMDADPPLSGPSTVTMGVHHVLSGNPNRFSTGDVRIAVDQEWRTRMTSRDLALVEAATWPFLRRYGYPVLVRR
jgi:hypothetical protein